MTPPQRLSWPTGTPAWIVEALTALAAADELSGVPPEVLSAICRFTSDWGLGGLGVNPEGFGGYFGQHVGWTYCGRSFTAGELTDTSTFSTQARAAAATLAGYGQPTVARALDEYATGPAGPGDPNFVSYVCRSTGAAPTGPLVGIQPAAPAPSAPAPPTSPPKPKEHEMKVGIVTFDNELWAVSWNPTTGRLERSHLDNPEDSLTLEALGATGVKLPAPYLSALPVTAPPA